jgi:hypothetical protein
MLLIFPSSKYLDQRHTFLQACAEVDPESGLYVPKEHIVHCSVEIAPRAAPYVPAETHQELQILRDCLLISSQVAIWDICSLEQIVSGKQQSFDHRQSDLIVNFVW